MISYGHFFIVEIILFMYPGLDMFRLFIQRLLKKKNPFKADMSHIHHLLLVKCSFWKTFLIIQISILLPIILSFFLNPIFSIFVGLIAYFSSFLYSTKLS